MGTNFYAVHIPTKSEMEQMQENLNNRNFESLKKIINDSTQKYHIGKRSGGWAFLFQAKESHAFDSETDVPWEDNIDSLKEYLNRDDVKIQNEYGDVFTSEEFWTKEIGNSLYVDNKHFDYKSYIKKHPDESFGFDTHEKTINGIRWCNVYFC